MEGGTLSATTNGTKAQGETAAQLTAAWGSDERWEGIERPYSAEDVV
ncbi:MAG: hypothetical protein H0T39_06350, partial [Actinobacteria bacterium]|nr:hypothetical protein [Actinomycetota bacterium]